MSADSAGVVLVWHAYVTTAAHALMVSMLAEIQLLTVNVTRSF